MGSGLTLSSKAFRSASYLTAAVPGRHRLTCFLFDNGSLRAAATLSLRRLAHALTEAIGVEVRAVSLLHSSGVDPAELGDTPAELLEPALLKFARAGGRDAVLLPLFFGPSAALTEYVPARVAAVQRQVPGLQVRLARWLVEPGDESGPLVAEMLETGVRAIIAAHGLTGPKVLLTDHGSPQPAVAAVRDLLGSLLRERLGATVSTVGVASMERRAGDEYRFNEPLLESALRRPPFDEGDVVVALQFLQPGRHAGPDGDIAQICAAVRRERPGLRTFMTPLLAEDPRLLELLARRYRDVATAPDRG
jgi:hypothetical protein